MNNSPNTAGNDPRPDDTDEFWQDCLSAMRGRDRPADGATNLVPPTTYSESPASGEQVARASGSAQASGSEPRPAEPAESAVAQPLFPLKPLPANSGCTADCSETDNSEDRVPANVGSGSGIVKQEILLTDVSDLESLQSELTDEATVSPQSGVAQTQQPRIRNETHPLHLAASTLLSLLMVLALLLVARWVVPSLVESVRYGWYRGQLRAEYELSGQRLHNVSLDSLADVSQLVSQRVGPSVVHVNLLRDPGTVGELERLVGRNHPSLRYEGQGSGFVIDASGYILTNYHVVEGVGDIEVTLSDGRQLPAKVVGVDPPTDLAMVKVEAANLMPIDWGDSDAVVVGTPVWAAGSPFGLQQTVTFGIISGKHRVDFRGTRYEEGIRGGNAYGDLMQSDVALNPGNSGGPLVNSMGEVIGVNAAILGETYHGVSFSIPSKVAQRVATHLMLGAQVPRGWLGVRMEDLAMEERFGVDGKANPGVRVLGFPQNIPSPARDAGLTAGDVIVEFDGHPVMNQVDLMRLIGETEVGASPQVAVLRQGKRTEFKVVIGKRELELN